jgi:ATP-binding cassette subfamily F protein uup
VQLLLLLAQKPNVLLLDEPTNDLDLDTLRSLEDFLDDWPGALVVVSHDRAFLERTVTDVLVMDEGVAARRPGGMAAWDAARSQAPAKRPAPAIPPGLPKGGPKAGKERSPSTLRRLIQDADKELAKLARRRGALEADVAAAAEAGDHARLAELGTELASLDAPVAAVEERWLELGAELEARSG